MDFEKLFREYKEVSLYGRYITLNHIEPILEGFSDIVKVTILGKSVLGKPIYLCKAGSGKTKILLWSQMHGNESTTTKALFDFFNVLQSESDEANHLLKSFTFYAIPILNPDGSKLFTRENANNVDLNRDFSKLEQPESRVLNELFNNIKPDYCYNLHDQRTIFGVGDSGLPATVSFLAPAFNESRDINESRLKAINIVAFINDVLQRYIPGQVGRFDDTYNTNCVGDTFQGRGVPTILFEAGHFPDDYQREESRKLIFMALLASFQNICDNVVVHNRIDDYLHISQNKPVFYDFVFKNVKINYDGNEIITNFAAQYNEELKGDKIVFNAYIAKVGDCNGFFGHVTFDARERRFNSDYGFVPVIDKKADFYLGELQFINASQTITSQENNEL